MKANKHLLLWSSLAALVVLVGAAVNENLLPRLARDSTAELQRGCPSSQADAFHDSTAADRQPRNRERRIVASVATSAWRRARTVSKATVSSAVILMLSTTLPLTAARFATVARGVQRISLMRTEAWPIGRSRCCARYYLYAGCGGCHTHLSVPNLAQLEKGKSHFEQADCLACHKLDGRGGTLRPGGAGGQEGPDLSRVGAAGFKANWYEQHVEQRKKAASGPWLSAFGDLSESERSEIDEFLRSRVGAPGLVEAKALFHTLGCRGCHKVRGVGGDDGPDLTAEGNKDPGQLNFAQVGGERTLANWLKQHFRAPASVVPGSAHARIGIDGAADRSAHLLYAVAAATKFSGGALAERPHPGRALWRERVRHRWRDALWDLLRRLPWRERRRHALPRVGGVSRYRQPRFSALGFRRFLARADQARPARKADAGLGRA